MNYWTTKQDYYLNTTITGLTTNIQSQSFNQLIPALTIMIESIYHRYFSNCFYFGEYSMSDLTATVISFMYSVIKKYDVAKGKCFAFVQTCIKNYFNQRFSDSKKMQTSSIEYDNYYDTPSTILNDINYSAYQTEFDSVEISISLKEIVLKKLDKFLSRKNINTGDTYVLTILKDYFSSTPTEYVNNHSFSFFCYTTGKHYGRSGFRSVAKKFGLNICLCNVSTLQKAYGNNVLELPTEIFNVLSKDHFYELEKRRNSTIKYKEVVKSSNAIMRM